MSERIAFRMVLKDGQAEAYRRRHDEIWPELSSALREAGVSDYTIWLDPENHHLYATLLRTADHTMDALPEQEIVQRWWRHMADLMATEPGGDVPVQVPLEPMFELR